MSDKLYGEDANVARVLEKIELAARRTAETRGYGFEQFANELQRIVKDMYNGK